MAKGAPAVERTPDAHGADGAFSGWQGLMLTRRWGLAEEVAGHFSLKTADSQRQMVIIRYQSMNKAGAAVRVDKSEELRS